MPRKVVKDQKDFFNQNAKKDEKFDTGSFFYSYSNKEQFEGFDWLADKKTILEYGCGTGTSINRFFETGRKRTSYKFIGVDIANEAIKKARENFPEYKFYTIQDNKIQMVKDGSVSGAFLYHVLHHSEDHQIIFDEIYSKLAVGGKFLINDLSSRNPIIRFGRYMFSYLSPLVSKKFENDLVVEGKIPDKYPVSVKDKLAQLENAGFKIKKVGYGHLFFFVFEWIDKFIPLSRISLTRWFYNKLIALENYLLKYSFFNRYAELFYIFCEKR